MWIFTTYGFFSFTQSTYTPGFIQIRARDERDLEDLKRRHRLKGKIIETPQADYRWRVLVKPETASRILADEAAAIDYSNFKDATTDRQHARPLMEVWSAMMRVQRARVAELYPTPEPPSYIRERNARARDQRWFDFTEERLFGEADDHFDPDAREWCRKRNRSAQGYGEEADDEVPF